MAQPLADWPVTRYVTGQPPVRHDEVLAVEELLEIHVNYKPVATTVRTPGQDHLLVLGFLLSAGFITAPRPTLKIALSPHIARVAIIRPPDRIQRGSRPATPVVRLETLLGLPQAMREHQPLFAATGATHAAGIFDAATGHAITVGEDVGRHNAVDKAIGWALLHDRLPLHHAVLHLSGRVSEDLVLKADLAGIPIISAVSAPSSAAASLADNLGVTLVGFSRGTSLNVYTHAERVDR